MNLAAIDSSKLSITSTGLQVNGELSFEEWQGFAPRFSEALKCAAFVIGDWLVYGENRFQNSRSVSTEVYNAALEATGLDRPTLYLYASVSRNVNFCTRVQKLSWEHHRAVASLDEPEQKQWLDQAVGNGGNNGVVSSRRLRKSIIAGRLITPEEMHPDSVEGGIMNHIPYINRLVAWWAKMREKNWLKSATPEQRAALKMDLEPVVAIYNQLGGRSE